MCSFGVSWEFLPVSANGFALAPYFALTPTPLPYYFRVDLFQKWGITVAKIYGRGAKPRKRMVLLD
jgi:hypothetical protein